MCLRITRLYFAFLLMAACCAYGAPSNDLSQSTVAAVLTRTGLDGAWRVQQSTRRDEFDGKIYSEVHVYTNSRQLTPGICIAEHRIIDMTREDDQISNIHQEGGEDLVLAFGDCQNLPQSARFRSAAGKISDAELAQFFAIMTSLIDTGSTKNPNISVKFATEEARSAIHEIRLENLFVVGEERDTVLFNFDVRHPGKVPCALALIVRIPRMLNTSSLLKNPSLLAI